MSFSPLDGWINANNPMDNSLAEFLDQLNGFDVSSSEIVALLNDQPRNAEEQLGHLTVAKISFQPLIGVPPKRQTAVLLRLMALLNTVSGLAAPSNKGWSDGPAFRAAARVPLYLFVDGSFGFNASSFAGEVAKFSES